MVYWMFLQASRCGIVEPGADVEGPTVLSAIYFQIRGYYEVEPRSPRLTKRFPRVDPRYNLLHIYPMT